MRRAGELRLCSRLEATPERVWARVGSFEGVNAELWPLLQMTAPAGMRTLDPEQVVLGERVGRSWILLLGAIPLDYDDLSFVRLDPGRGFLERSRMLSQRIWEHERTLAPDGASRCLITDRLRFEPRLPVPGAVVRPLVSAVFRHRHRRLRRHFGGTAVRSQ